MGLLIPRRSWVMRDFGNNELNVQIDNVWTNREKKERQVELR